MERIDRTAETESPQGSGTEADFESAREADHRLANQIARAASLRLAGLVIVTILLIIGSVQQGALADSGQLISEIDALQSDRIAADMRPDLNPFIVLFQKPEWPSSSVLPPPPGSSANAPDAEALVAALNQKGEALSAKYNELYGAKLSILGTDLRVDLRILILTLPLWLCSAYIYIQVLRLKHHSLAAVLERRLSEAGFGQATTMDLVLYGQPYRQNAFRRYPGALYGFGLWLVSFVLLWAVLSVNWGTLRSSDAREGFLLVLDVVALPVILSWAYTLHVARQLSRQMESTFHYCVPDPWAVSLWKRFSAWFGRSVWQTRPRVSLTAGSVLVLLTLFLSTSQVSCTDRGGQDASRKERPGYEFILGRASWPPAINTFIFESVGRFENSLARWLYLGAQLLAAVTLAWSLATVWLPKLRATAVHLFRVSGVYSLFLIADYASKHLFGLWWSWLILWLAAVAVWLAPWPRGAIASRWRSRLRHGLTVLYIPALLASLTYLASVTARLPGLAALYAGAHLLTIGYRAAAAQTAREPSPVGAAAATQ